MHKLATEILDFKDDDGALLRQIFSSYEEIPECIKQANLDPPNNHQYAFIDGGFKKFALHDQGNTWLSLIYFSAHQDKLPEELRKEAAVEIAANLTRWADPIPKELKEMANSLKSKGVEVTTRERNWDPHNTLQNVVNDRGDTDAGVTLVNKQNYKDRSGESVFDRYNETKEVTTKEAMNKEAIIGPIINMATLGVPGLVGSVLGSRKGRELYNKSEAPAPESTAKHMLIPGYQGYRSGLNEGMLDQFRKQEPEYLNHLNSLKQEGFKSDNVDDMDQELANRGIKLPNMYQTFHPISGEISWNKFPSKQEKTATLLGGKFPVDTFSQIKQAQDYFLENWREFALEERKEYCEKLSQRMEELGLKPEGDIARYGSTKYAEDVEVYTLARKQFVLPEEHFILENLVEKIAQVEPSTYAEALKVFDEEFGLDRFWDSQLVDPYKSTFGPEKIAEEWRYNYRNVYISEENLNKLKLQDVEQVLGKDLAERFIFAPKKVFERLPNDKKYVIARLSMQELPA